MSIKETAFKQFEKFRDDLASTDISRDSPIANARENLIHELRIRHKPGGDKVADVYDKLCSDHLRNINFSV